MPLFMQEYAVPEYKYNELILQNEYSFDVRYKWETHKPSIYTLFDEIDKAYILSSIIDDTREDYAALVLYKDVLVLVDLNKRNIAVSLASSDRNAINEVLEKLKKMYPPEPDQMTGKVKVRFWYNTNSGPRNVVRQIAVPSWETIKNNYEAETFKQLKFLIEEYKASTGGQLIIMSGIPGTGKSYYLRSLLHSWQDWCTADYVLDPENLFGGSQGYFADVVLRDSYDEEFQETGDDTGKWKLIILEDSGELLVPDAKDRVGQALSRLLNLVDGLIGQGLRVLVLITTNEDFDRLHSAVARDGRCAAAIQFNALPRTQAEAWMNGSAPKLPEGKEKFTLAELYALVNGTSVKKLEKQSTKFGFRVPNE